jgi:hypothetical protein
LTTLARRPGRLYQGRHEDVTPLTPMLRTATDLASKLGDVVKGDLVKRDGK